MEDKSALSNVLRFTKVSMDDERIRDLSQAFPELTYAALERFAQWLGDAEDAGFARGRRDGTGSLGVVTEFYGRNVVFGDGLGIPPRGCEGAFLVFRSPSGELRNGKVTVEMVAKFKPGEKTSQVTCRHQVTATVPAIAVGDSVEYVWST